MTNTQQRYKIVKIDNLEALELKVNNYLDLGYELVGAPFLIHDTLWCQAIISKRDK